VSPGDASADESPLQFPTDYPIKVVGRTERSFRARVDAIVFSHTPDLTEDRISERASGAGNFTSITYTIVARDRDHVTTLVTALVATEGVLMVI
jgi:putative lipoic acid-binding regulatory protein